MSADFNRKKAIEEQIAGMAEVMKALTIEENQATQDMARAEQRMNAMAKLKGYAAIELDRLRQLKALVEEQEKQEQNK